MIRPLSRLAPLALATAAVCLAPASTFAQGVSGVGAINAVAAQRIDIPAQALAQALNEWARQTRIQLLVQQGLVAGRTAPAVAGLLTPRQALAQLLAGSGLVGTVEGGAMVVRPAHRTEGPAQSGANTGASTLPEVTVNAVADTLADAPGVQARMASAAPKVIVERAQFEVLGDKRVSDIAGRLPGTFAGGPPGEKKSINLRGVSSEFARFSFEGITLPSSAGSRNIDLQRISSFIVEDVTYLRSPSAEYEADGLAGRLAMRARVVPDKPVFEADLGLGGLNALDGGNRSLKLGYAGRLNERFGLIAALGYDRFDSIKIKDRSELTFAGGGGPAQNLGFLIDEREPKRNTNTNLFLDLVHYHAGGEVHLKPVVLDTLVDNVGRRRDQYNRVPGTFRQRTLASGGEDGRTSGVTLEGKHRFVNDVEIDAALTSSRATRTTASNEVALGSNLAFASGTASEGRVDDRLHQVGFNVTVPVAGSVAQLLKFGALLRDTRQTTDSELFTVSASGVRSQTPTDVTRSRASDSVVSEDYRAAFVQDEVKAGAWTLLPGVRFEQVELGTSGVIASDVQRRFSHWLPSLPVSYRWSDDLVLRGSVARHINRPKLDELAPGVATRGNRTFTGNPSLVPATSRSIDLGADYARDDVFVGVNVFQRNIKNLIETLEPSANNFVYRNVGNGVIRGIELEQRVRLAALGPEWLRNVSVSANQAFLRSQVDDPTTGPRAFAEQPKFIANLTLEYRQAPTGFAASLGLNHIGKRGIVSNEGASAIRDKTIKAQTFIDARFEWRFSPQIALYAGAENITDQKRDEFEFLNGALNRTAVIATGRTYSIGLNWKH